MIANQLVNQSIDYIIQHLDEEISIEDVATIQGGKLQFAALMD